MTYYISYFVLFIFSTLCFFSHLFVSSVVVVQQKEFVSAVVVVVVVVHTPRDVVASFLL